MRTNFEIIQQHYAASERMDIDAMFADLAPDVVWTEMDGSPYPGTFVGLPAIGEGVFQRIGSEWEGFGFKLERLFDAGDAIIATGWYGGIFKKTGKSLKCRTVHIWQLSEGKIRKFEQFTDTRLFAAAMSKSSSRPSKLPKVASAAPRQRK